MVASGSRDGSPVLYSCESPWIAAVDPATGESQELLTGDSPIEGGCLQSLAVVGDTAFGWGNRQFVSVDLSSGAVEVLYRSERSGPQTPCWVDSIVADPTTGRLILDGGICGDAANEGTFAPALMEYDIATNTFAEVELAAGIDLSDSYPPVVMPNGDVYVVQRRAADGPALVEVSGRDTIPLSGDGELNPLVGGVAQAMAWGDTILVWEPSGRMIQVRPYTHERAIVIDCVGRHCGPT